MKEASEKVKFRLKIGRGGVQEFADASGVVYRPGEVVDLPSIYEGEVWLERVDPVPAVVAVPGKVEPVESAAVPLEAPKAVKKRASKKSVS